MRRVLIDYARAHRAEQRGGGLKRVEMQDDLAISAEKLDEVEALDSALTNLEGQNRGRVRSWNCAIRRSVGGANSFTSGVSPRSVKRDWSLARIWLFRELQQGATPSPGHRK